MEDRRSTRVLLYLRGEHAERLMQVVSGLVPREEMEVFGTIERFSERLRRPGDGGLLAVILAADAKDLDDIVSVSLLLRGVRCILVLPDREDATVAAGHSLRPRFMSYGDSDFRDVAGVLGRLMEASRGADPILVSPFPLHPRSPSAGTPLRDRK